MDAEKKKISFIVNPKSGTQSKEHILHLLDEKLDRMKFLSEIVYTEYAGHAIEIAAQKAKENEFAVVAIGGDGTINEIARSLVHTKTALGIIPCGSGNGLARHLQIPMDSKRAIEIINGGVLDVIDYGKINDVPFFCTCGVGFDAFVSLKFAKAGRRGPLTYLEKTLLESLKYQPETYELETEDGTLKYKAFLIACGNASQYGNNAYIAPQATLTDGLLDVTILEPFTVLDVPSLSFQLFNKTIDQNSRIKTFRCRKLRIHRTKPGVVHFDGDPMMMGEDIEVKVFKEELQVIVPPYAEKDSSNVLQRAQDYINGLKQINEAIVEDIAQKNKMILDKSREQINKSKEQIKKLTKI
ncbi:diacylglycerol kinase family lipid kinase [uncultured Bacteroides sp.]|uniref:diacylglycerol/lipid kinase family protein n=1 Tax=uncultured Bacteroides sp. TaxID=162156 RepID=UPI0025EC4FCC|nr:diacylglycerol kinase family lipid kinase [uncultured Bacteroides sp.]